MTVGDISGWTGVTNSVVTCGRGTFFGKIRYWCKITNLNILIIYIFLGEFSQSTATKTYTLNEPHYSVNIAMEL